MNIILFDDESRDNLLPITYTRPVADIRIGILTIREKWERHLNSGSSSLTQDYLQNKYPCIRADENLLISGSVCPSEELVTEVKALNIGEALITDNFLIACVIDKVGLESFNIQDLTQFQTKNSAADILRVEHLWDIFINNGTAIEQDFSALTSNRESENPSDTNCVLGSNLFMEEGVKMECATINTDTGPVYIGKNVEIMEGTHIRGPFAIGEGSVIKMDAKIYGPTTIGPHCRAGGEISNCVFLGYSNKGHDGFLGNSVIGEWCNLGADTNNSNLKNNYGQVKLWSYSSNDYEDTGLQFCGLIMGDHSKCGINTMFNTGTVVGVNANIFGAGFQPKLIPSFAWGSDEGDNYDIGKAIEVAKTVCERRNVEFTKEDEDILTHIYNSGKS